MWRLCSFLLLATLSACTIQSSLSNRYLSAEKLWTEKNYAAAVLEFDRIVKESPNTSLGLQSLWRASMTRTLFLNQQEDALKGLLSFIERASSSELVPQVQREIGDIYFSKLNQYSKAIEYYQKLLTAKKFSDEDRALFSYRIARSHFLSNQIKKAIELDEQVIEIYPKSFYALKAKLDLGNCWYALGDTDKQAYAKALQLFQSLEASSHESFPELYQEAVFGEAATREELDQLEEAYALFKKIEKTYPASKVIQIRMLRIEQRMKKKRK